MKSKSIMSGNFTPDNVVLWISKLCDLSLYLSIIRIVLTSGPELAQLTDSLEADPGFFCWPLHESNILQWPLINVSNLEKDCLQIVLRYCEAYLDLGYFFILSILRSDYDVPPLGVIRKQHGKL